MRTLRITFFLAVILFVLFAIEESLSPAVVETIVLNSAPPPIIEILPPPPAPSAKIPPSPLPAEALAKAGPPPPRIPDATIYALGIEATVNLVCSTKDHTYTIASGAIVDSAGYILSNAHVARNLADGKTCAIRRGSPATSFGTAHLVFIPTSYDSGAPADEAAQLDVSIWKLDSPPASLKYWQFADTFPKPGEELATLAYSAELLGDEITLKALPLLFSTAIVESTDGFIIRSGSSLSAQHGSSGGVLIDRYTSRVMGLIFGIDQDTDRAVSTRHLYALTPFAVDAAIKADTNKTLAEFIASAP